MGLYRLELPKEVSENGVLMDSQGRSGLSFACSLRISLKWCKHYSGVAINPLLYRLVQYLMRILDFKFCVISLLLMRFLIISHGNVIGNTYLHVENFVV